MSYVEYCKTPCQNPDDHDIVSFGSQPWGSIREYKVDHYASTTWCASIDGILKLCAITQGAPSEMIVFSEIHANPNNDLDTRFSAVFYRTSNGIWYLFDQEYWSESCPYLVQKDQPYYFRTYRGSCIYLPISRK